MSSTVTDPTATLSWRVRNSDLAEAAGLPHDELRPLRYWLTV